MEMNKINGTYTKPD